MKIDIPRINYALDVIRDIENSLEGASRANFEENRDKKDANLRRIEVISEILKSISEELMASYPAVEWKKFMDIKNVFMNQYFGVDWNIVWSILKKDIPVLKEQIEVIKKEINGINFQKKLL